jgi:hypothetical protein
MLEPNRGYRRVGHYCSEQYTSGERLLLALREDWTIRDIHPYSASLSRGRVVIVYSLTLQRATETALIHVLANPFVTRFLAGVLEPGLTFPT